MKFKNLFNRINESGNNEILSQQEISRIHDLPRFTKGNTRLFNKRIEFTDSGSFLSSFDEIFKNEIYKFEDKVNSELIMIDCGANIGLSTIYLKLKYPKANLLSFEPDPNIFNALRNNIQSFGFTQVELFNEAIGAHKGNLFFKMEGGHSGMIVEGSKTNTVSVPVTSLKNVIENFSKIDFLKIDIEGYEINVIPDIANELKKVNKLFLEYHTFIDQPQQLAEVLKIIEAADFRYYIKEGAYKKNPFLEKELFYKMDMLVNIFCYR